MTMATETATKSPPFAKGSIIWEKKGPLPVWAWALILLGLVLAVVMWRKNKNAADATEVATGDPSALPGNQSAGPIFIVPQAATPAVNVTVPTAPPGAGRPWPPRATPPIPSAPAQLPAFTNVKAGMVVDDWINGLQAAGYNVYWNQLVEWNKNQGPGGIMGNVTASNDPRKRVFKYDTAYRVRP